MQTLRHFAGAAKLRYAQWREEQRYRSILTNGSAVYAQMAERDSGSLESVVDCLDFRNGPRLALRDGHSGAHTFYEIFLDDQYPKRLLKDTETVIDVGANIGLFSYYARLQSPNARIFAFEADPATFSVLSENVSDLSIRCSNAAVASRDGELEFYSSPISGWSSAYPIMGAANAEKVRVPAIKLSSFLRDNNIKEVDFLKVDVEGAEYDILLGDHYLWETKIRRAVVEVDRDPRDKAYAYSDLYSFLIKRFPVVQETKCGDYPILICSL